MERDEHRIGDFVFLPNHQGTNDGPSGDSVIRATLSRTYRLEREVQRSA